MKKVICLIVLLIIPLYTMLFADQIGEDLRSKGFHIAILNDEDKINLQMNELEQAIRQQCLVEILQIISNEYKESNPSISKRTLKDNLESTFLNLSSQRGFPTQTNLETGQTVTSSYDFYIINQSVDIQSGRALVNCKIGFSHASKKFKEIPEMLELTLKDGNWYLERSKNFFNWLKIASDASIDEVGSLTFPGRTLHYTKDDLTSSNLLVPVTLYHYGKTPIPRFNKIESLCWFGVNCMNSPYGIIADVEVWKDGPDFNHNYFFVSDVTSNKIIGSDHDNWVGEFGTQGSGEGQFWGPHGMCTSDGYYYFTADMFNNRVTAYIYYNQLDEPQWHTEFDLPGEDIFNHPVDVEAKDRNPYDQQDVTYIAVADEGNHRIVLFHWAPWSLGWDRNYGEYGSGQGQFMWPTSVCFGRNPETGYQTDDIYITDYGNRRLVRIYITRPEGVIWRATYQFPEGAELTSVDVDNKGLVYVVDRHHGKVYKFAPSQTYPYYFKLLGVWGETGTGDGQLDHPNSIQIAHGRYVPYPNPWIPLTGLGDVFVTESWGDQTGVRRFVIAADVLNLAADWVPYNEDTGEGNFIWWEYHLTDFATITEQVLRGAEVCTTYNRGSLNYGSQGGAWPVDGHPHGTDYTVKITASSIYDPTIVIEKNVDVYVDTFTTHDPIITRGIRCHWIDSLGLSCNYCWECLKEWHGYRINVQAYDPDGDSLTYVWRCKRGDFWLEECGSCNPCTTDLNEICYQAPQAPSVKGDQPYEVIDVIVRDPFGGSNATSFTTNDIFDYDHSCPCGDANSDGDIGAGDVVFLLSYLFRGGPPPVDPIDRGDANNDCVIGAGDINYLLEYICHGGDPPECCWIHE